jgi:MFS family permease
VTRSLQLLAATAIPKITTEFDSINDIAWYGSVYLLAQISIQPTFGRIYTFFNLKWTYLTALLVFEVGSVVCATATSSLVFILGRAIAGVGSAAVFAGDMTILVHSISPRRRVISMSFVGSMFGAASVLSPPIGGLITDASRLGWRFCFWINLREF